MIGGMIVKNHIYNFLYSEDGAASIEMAIISVVLVSIAIAFRKQLKSLAIAIADKLLGE